jgi:hypothetical protein
MKYHALLIATAVAAWAMRLADAVTTVAARSAEAADDLSVKAERAAYKVRVGSAVAKYNKVYEAFIRQQAAYFVLLDDIETASVKHSWADSIHHPLKTERTAVLTSISRVITDTEGDDVPVAN